MKPDVFVVGGGPAGLAAAIAATRKGFRVVLADSGRPPIDKACGEGLMPDSIEAARQLGIDIPATLGREFRGIRFVGEGASVASHFPNGKGLGVRRPALHLALVRSAERAGVQLLWETPVTEFDEIEADWLIGADGSHSRFRRWAALDQFERNTSRYGFRQHFALAPWSEFMEIHWGAGCQFYITPVSAREICVAVISRWPDLRLFEALDHFPELKERLWGAAVVSRERGGVSATRQLKDVARGNIALIGDAAGSVDAITGEGLCLAFQQAAALAEALECGDISLYAAAHRRILRRPAFMADFMLLMDRAKWVRVRALRALAERPKLFENLLAMHVGRLQTIQFAETASSLLWQMARA